MDFGKLPPEINTVRMYAGPGPQSMLAAAAAWDQLSGQLYDVATSYHSTTAGLAGRWRGPAATAMAETTAPYIRWFNATAADAAQTAAQARAAADAYQSAFAATVPPPVLIANRALRTSLIATNSLGHNTPAIAAAEADYERMWIQDAAAMYAYAHASAAVSTLTPSTSPPTAPVTGPSTRAATADREVISTAAQIISILPEALEALSSASPQRFGAALLSMSPLLSKLSSLRLGFAKEASVPIAVAIAGATKAVNAHRATVTAGVGRTTSIGALSVPQTWLPAPSAGVASADYHSAAAAIGRWVSGRVRPGAT